MTLSRAKSGGDEDHWVLELAPRSTQPAAAAAAATAQTRLALGAIRCRHSTRILLVELASRSSQNQTFNNVRIQAVQSRAPAGLRNAVSDFDLPLKFTSSIKPLKARCI